MSEETLRLLINTSSATLLGKKPSSLISVTKKEFEKFYKELFLIESNKIKFKIIDIKKEKIIIFIYNVSLLDSVINNKINKYYLKKHGYKGFNDIFSIVDELKENIMTKGITPEVGIFLGIPIEDVIEYQKGNRNYLFLGYWQVFYFLEKKKEIFSSFDKCKAKLKDIALSDKNLELVF